MSSRNLVLLRHLGYHRRENQWEGATRVKSQYTEEPARPQYTWKQNTWFDPSGVIEYSPGSRLSSTSSRNSLSLILVASRGRVKKTLFNVSFILSEMKSGRPAYLANEELDVKSNKAMRLPHGATIAVGALFFLAISAHFTR